MFPTFPYWPTSILNKSAVVNISVDPVGAHERFSKDPIEVALVDDTSNLPNGDVVPIPKLPVPKLNQAF